MSAMAASPFCQSPLRFTCPDSAQAGKNREAKIDKIELDLKNIAFKNTVQSITDADLKSQLKTFEDIDELTPKRKRKSVEKIFYANLRMAFSAYLTKSHLQNNLGFDMIREALHIAIDNSKEIPSEYKTQMHNTLNETRLVTFQNNVEDDSLQDVHALYKDCSKKSFVDNAFATELHGQKVVMVCPGEIIGSIEYGNDFHFSDNLKLIPLVMTLGHELSHHFDWRILPDAYKSTLQTLAQKSSQLGGPLENYMSEITADMWGLKTTKILTDKITNENLRSLLFSGSLDDLCGTRDDGEHPSGKFRIEQLAENLLCH
jgi:hypothetical protein